VRRRATRNSGSSQVFRGKAKQPGRLVHLQFRAGLQRRTRRSRLLSKEAGHDQDQAEPTGQENQEQQRRTLERKPDLVRKDADGEIVADGANAGRDVP
jgi:hypothetical protein